MNDFSTKYRKETGAHYTPKILADFVAEQIVNLWRGQSRPKRFCLLDPSVGDGQLLLSLLEKLRADDYSGIEVSGFDTSSDAVQSAGIRIRKNFRKFL